MHSFPSRSYADVIVHRVLMAALGLRPLPETLRDRELMSGVVGNANTRHRWVAVGRREFEVWGGGSHGMHVCCGCRGLQALRRSPPNCPSARLPLPLLCRCRNAQMAGRASVELHTLIFFRSRVAIADARVTKARRCLPCSLSADCLALCGAGPVPPACV